MRRNGEGEGEIDWERRGEGPSLDVKWSLDSIGIGALAARRVCALPASKVEMRMGRERWVLLME